MSGYADLPLHRGVVPYWLANRMIKLTRIVLKILVDEYGTKGVLERLSDPVWFQALNNLIGMDWDSSGSTTVTCGIIKQVLSKDDVGIKAAGGKGKRSRKTPDELKSICSSYGLNADEFIRISRLVAKVDNVAIQCGYTLYHHMFFVDNEGNWAVVQQGMNPDVKMARRFHWFSGTLESFEREPHKAISGIKHTYALNTVARRIDEFRRIIIDLAGEKASTIERYIKTILAIARGNTLLSYYTPYDFKKVSSSVKKYRSLGKVSINRAALSIAREISVDSFSDLLLIKGFGPSTLRGLALVAELIYETPPSWKDPVTHPVDPFKFAYAVGGKDGVPFPVDKETYDEIISFLSRLMDKAGRKNRLLFKRLAKVTKNWNPPEEEKIPT